MNVVVVMAPGWEQKIKIESSQAIHRIVREVEQAAHRNLLPHTNTGELISSLRSTVSVGGGRVWIGTDHWHFLEYGTRPHIINPRTKQALWWTGALHPVRRVRHPGTPERAPMRRALASVRW